MNIKEQPFEPLYPPAPSAPPSEGTPLIHKSVATLAPQDGAVRTEDASTMTTANREAFKIDYTAWRIYMFLLYIVSIASVTVFTVQQAYHVHNALYLVSIGLLLILFFLASYLIAFVIYHSMRDQVATIVTACIAFILVFSTLVLVLFNCALMLVAQDLSQEYSVPLYIILLPLESLFGVVALFSLGSMAQNLIYGWYLDMFWSMFQEIVSVCLGTFVVLICIYFDQQHQYIEGRRDIFSLLLAFAPLFLIEGLSIGLYLLHECLGLEAHYNRHLLLLMVSIAPGAICSQLVMLMYSYVGPVAWVSLIVPITSIFLYGAIVFPVLMK